MATERQIAANRANAARSTGPKTATGRLRSSRNAFRHGLSSPLRLDMVTSAKIDAIAQALTGDDFSEERVSVATEVAKAQLDLCRIRAVRAHMIATVDLVGGDLQQMRRLLPLHRYERLAQIKRRRASQKL
jgi:hypothetical protein